MLRHEDWLRQACANRTTATAAVAAHRAARTRLPSTVERVAPEAATHVTFIQPPILMAQHTVNLQYVVPPLGLAYVAAVIENAGHHVDVVDGLGEGVDAWTRYATPIGQFLLRGLTPEEIAARIDPQTRIVAIGNLIAHELVMVYQIARQVRARLPHVTIVVGGENATACWRDMFTACEALDYCICGEGEMSFARLVAHLGAGRSADGLPAVASRTSTAPPRPEPRIAHVDEIPWPAWHLFPMEAYLRQSETAGLHCGRTIPTLATRGCPYQCTFCSSPQMWTTRYVVRDPGDLVDEMRYYVTRYNVINIDFFDLTLAIKRSWLVRFCTHLLDARLNISWQLPVGTRSEILDRETLQLMFDAGCRYLVYAPESGSQQLLERMNKPLELSHLLTSLAGANQIGFVTRLNLISGHPGETRRHVWDTLSFVLRGAWRGCNEIFLSPFNVYPGSEDYEALRRDGVVGPLDDAFLASMLRRQSRTHLNRWVAPWERNLMWLLTYLAFYATSYALRPRRFIGMVKGVFTGQDADKFGRFVRLRAMLIRQRITSGWASMVSPGRSARRRP